jgi:hypothetical protein
LFKYKNDLKKEKEKGEGANPMTELYLFLLTANGLV